MITRRITRAEFQAAIEAGLSIDAYIPPEDAEALREIGRTADEALTGAFCLEGHSCPAMQAGIYAPRPRWALQFAYEFDAVVPGRETTLLEVVG